jgi:hypothetical protein
MIEKLTIKRIKRFTQEGKLIWGIYGNKIYFTRYPITNKSYIKINIYDTDVPFMYIFQHREGRLPKKISEYTDIKAFLDFIKNKYKDVKESSVDKESIE